MPSILSCLISVLLMSPGGTGDISAYGFLGFGMSQFEDDILAEGDYVTLDNGSYIPAGVAFFYQVSPKFQLGAEVEVAASPFSGDYTWNDGYESGTGEWEMSMTTVGAVAKFLPSNEFYLRGGVANYSGEIEGEDAYGTGEVDMESGIGFNFGAGYVTPLSENVFGALEGVYHMVSLKPDVPVPADDLEFNHYAVRAMIGTGL